ncbi:MAG: zinc dependent phospholipase C family protein [Oscillospiraceae bacterium]|nr:zinc dependent phospholipase C family protein [Oscillospiraceae bacterium]
MAALDIHIQIANHFIDILKDISPSQFMMGTIVPDCGGAPQVSHYTSTGEKDAIRSQEFYDTYVKYEEDPELKSFFLGYYVHLLADTAWWNHVWIPASIKYAKEIEKDRKFIKEIKTKPYDVNIIINELQNKIF